MHLFFSLLLHWKSTLSDLPLSYSQKFLHLIQYIESSSCDSVSIFILNFLSAFVVVYSPWCSGAFHSLFISPFFPPLVPFLGCAVGECCSGRQTDTGRVLWTTVPLTSLPSFLPLLFLLSCITTLPLLNSDQPEVHERTFFLLIPKHWSVTLGCMCCIFYDGNCIKRLYKPCMWHVFFPTTTYIIKILMAKTKI